MTGTLGFRSDDEHLANRLRRLDPARGVAPLTEHKIEEIIMDTTTRDAPTDAPSTKPRPARRRGRVVMAGMAVAGAAAIATAVMLGQPRVGETVALSLPDPGVSMSCAPLAAEFIADTQFAFEGRVTGLEGSRVTLEVLHQYTGEPASTVTVPQGPDELISVPTVEFELGGTYLVSAVDGVVTTCGMSGPATPELKALYEAAFS